MKGIQNTSTENFSTIIGSNKKFIVPKFQRDYSWSTEQWDDLWLDIESMISNNEGDHYMGYLVLQTNDDKNHQIIDGQQRLTTIMVLILASMKCIDNFIRQGIDLEDNKKRLASLKLLYVGKEDPVSLDYDNILVLNRHNNQYYKDYIVKLDNSQVRGLSISEKLLKSCFSFYIDKLNGKFSSGKEYAGYIQLIADSLYFTKIVVSDDLNAFKVFETLNARGVQLSSSDLLKNYLFSLVDYSGAHASRVDALEQKWAKLNDIVKTEKLPEFLRYYWNSKHKSIRSNAVFKTIRSQIKSERDVFQLIDDMIRYSNVYMALTDKNDELWGTDGELRKLVELLSIFKLKQPFPALMSAYIFLDGNDFKRVLKYIINICFRYNVICDKNPNDQDVPFNQLAISIFDTNSADLTVLDRIYIEDGEFERTFAEKTFPYNSRNVKVIRYILGKIDHFNGSLSEVEPSDEDASIEHILPLDFSEKWNIEESKAAKFVDRLGNMSLLERGLNRAVQNADYRIKVEAYKQSSYLSSQGIPDKYPDVWDEESIAGRQKQMAKVAKGIWRV